MHNDSETQFCETSARIAVDGPVVALTDSELEAYRIGQICLGNSVRQHRLGLTYSYLRRNEPNKAQRQIRKLLSECRNDEERTEALRMLAQGMEIDHDFESAASFYRRGLSYLPKDPYNAYSCHSNLAACLVRLKQFAEAEKSARDAIEIDPTRASAQLNLGQALEGQGRVREAAAAFVQAARADSADPRALNCLEHLLIQNPSFQHEFQEALNGCESAVRSTNSMGHHPGADNLLNAVPLFFTAA